MQAKIWSCIEPSNNFLVKSSFSLSDVCVGAVESAVKHIKEKWFWRKLKALLCSGWCGSYIRIMGSRMAFICFGWNDPNMHVELHICFHFCARVVIMRNDVAHRVLPAIFIDLCWDLTLESCDEQVIRFQCFWNQCLCGHLLPYGMYLVLDMLYVFWIWCYVFSCGLLHCLALEVIESLLEQANFYMKEIPLSDLNFSIGDSGLLWCELQLMLDDSVLQGWNCEIRYYSLIYELGSEMNWPNC